VTYKGEDVLKMSKKKLTELRRKNVSMIFQDPSAALNPVFTVRQQLYDIIKFSTDGRLSGEELHERAVECSGRAPSPSPIGYSTATHSS